MSKFCRKCGAPISGNEKFCSNCGASLYADKKVVATPPTTMNSDKSPNIITRHKKVMISIVAAILILGAGSGYYLSQSAPENTTATKQVSPEDQPKEKADAEPVVVDPTEATKKEMAALNINGSVMATTYGNNDKGYVALLGGKGRQIIAVDKINNQVAFIDFYNGPIDFLHKGSSSLPTNGKYLKDSTTLFRMSIQNDVHGGGDDRSGEWRGTEHILPIFGAYTADFDEKVTPGRLTTGAGFNPKHLQGYLQEQKNVDLANLVLTETPVLVKTAANANIKL